jgi:hypothetical protein
VTETPDPNSELRLHPGWWARLEGEDLDLKALASGLGDESPVRVVLFDGRHYMWMTEFDTMDDSHAVETRASAVLRVVNGAARVAHGDSREVRVDAVAKVRPAGQIQHFVHASAALHLRARVLVTLTVSGAPEGVSEPTITERAVDVALGDPQAERGLRIFGRDDVDYRDLYHVFEIAEAAIGDAIFVDGTVTRAEVTRFKHTANSVHALGDQARHGHETTQPPPAPTSFADAQALVGRVLRVWLCQTRR